jgi:hypothetical protein
MPVCHCNRLGEAAGAGGQVVQYSARVTHPPALPSLALPDSNSVLYQQPDELSLLVVNPTKVLSS